MESYEGTNIMEMKHGNQSLNHQDMVGLTQAGRGGLGTTSYKPLCLSTEQEKQNNVIKSGILKRKDDIYILRNAINSNSVLDEKER